MRDEQIRAVELQKKEAEAERKKKLAARLKCTEEVQNYLSQFSDIYSKISNEAR